MGKLSILLTVLAVLIALTNIFGEVIKKVVPKLPAQVVVAISAIILTVCAIIGYCIYYSVPFEWYYAVAGILGGVVVSYGAMFGYDNLYKQIAEALSKGSDKNE